MNIKKVFIWGLVLFSFCFNVYADEIDTNNNNTSTNTNTSNIATLDDISINSEKVVCDNFVCSKIIKDNSVSEVLITYKTTDSLAVVSKKEIKETLETGENVFKVVVTAPDLVTKQEYTFKITKEVLSTDSSLKTLVVNGVSIKLNKNTTKYETTVSYSTKKIEFEATSNDSKATIENFTSNKASYDFFDTSKDFKIKVIAEAGDMTTYTISIKRRDEALVTLKTLKIKNASFDFNSDTFEYETTVLKSVENLEIEAIPTDTNATVEIDKPEKLEIGENTIKINVSNDGNLNTYLIKITRLNEDKGLANLKSLKIEGYDLPFEDSKYEYDLKIKDENYLVIDAIPQVEDSKVEIFGNLDLVNGSIIKIKVNYDSTNSSIYEINIIKDIIKEEKESKLLLIIIITIISLIIILTIIFIIIKTKKKGNNKEKVKSVNKPNILNEDIEEII